jgi:curved DNA-binding protein CbpA
VGRFEFDASEQTILDVLRAKPQNYTELMATDLLEPARLSQLVALLVLSKHMNVPGSAPLGVVASQSVSPVMTRRAVPRVAPSVTPPDRESVTSSPPGTVDRRREVMEKVRSMENADFYQVLGLEVGSDPSMVQAAFLQLAKAWHPDRLPLVLSELKPEVTKIFARMTEAHQILSNAKNRAEYDKLRAGGGNTDDEQRKVQEVLRAAAAFQKAEVLAKREDWAQALKFAEQAFQGDPEQAEYAALYAWIAARAPERSETNTYDDLLDVLHRAVKQQRNNVRVRLYRAAVFKLAGQTVEAMRDYRSVSELDPTNVEAQREIRLHRMRKDSSPPPGVLKRFFNKKP